MIVTGPGADAAAKTIAEQLPQQLPEDVTRPDFSPRKDVNEDGSAARVDVVLNADPYSTTAFDMLDRATEQAGEIAGSEVRVASAGETATARDSAAEVTHDFTLLVPLIFLVIALILGLLLRSWLAPIYLIATLGLSFAATLGLVAYITLTVQGDTGFGSYVPVYVLVFLTALGVDYTIFVMARLREEMRDKTMAEAMHRAIITTGGVVSSAGLILAATFAVLMMQLIRELYQFGMAMMLGILIDTFIIRPLMVPAIVTLLGDRALLPAKPGQESREASMEPVPAS
ncbi:MMPL family transporter [Corynebacterium diphtheriae]|nr:MMPL family transporter [Corynebacterium diphtheriae]CAB0649783.1 MMPL family transporter [Corynebacterium diphtheriae]